MKTHPRTRSIQGLCRRTPRTALIVLAVMLLAGTVKLDAADRPVPPNTLTDADSVVYYKNLRVRPLDAWQPVPISTKAQQTAGYGGGEGFQMIWCIKYAPANPNIVYMVVDTSQVWKSTEKGTGVLFGC